MASLDYKKFTDLYDAVKGDDEPFMGELDFQSKLDALVEERLIIRGSLSGSSIYAATPGLWPKDFQDREDSIQKAILSALVKFPDSTFILELPQSGKLRLMANEFEKAIKSSQRKGKKLVGLFGTSNDGTLAEQSKEGIKKYFGDRLHIKLFLLSSTSKEKTTINDIKAYIGDYLDDKHGVMSTPMICYLANEKQCEKIVRLMKWIHQKVLAGYPLTILHEFDEVDVIYPRLREQSFEIDEELVSMSTYTYLYPLSIYGLVFATATPEKVIDYCPECSNAHILESEIPEEHRIHYRSLSHPDSILHDVKYNSKDSNNSYALKIVKDNLPHFTDPITLPSGELYYPKTLVFSNRRTVQMDELAEELNHVGITSIVFNGEGGTSIRAYCPGEPRRIFKTKGKDFKKYLFCVYKHLRLEDKPLMMIGNGKMGRGTGFPYCPHDPNETLIADFKDELGIVTFNPLEGLVWNNIILPDMDDPDRLVQSVGRVYGIVAKCAQYPGKQHFWMSNKSYLTITHHHEIVQEAKRITGPIGNAFKQAEDNIPKQKINHEVDPKTFRVYDSEQIWNTAREILGIRAHPYEIKDGFWITSLFDIKSCVLDLLIGIKKVPVCIHKGGGTTFIRRMVPCYKDVTDSSTLCFLVPISIDYTHEMIEELDRMCPSILIPKIGDF
jgi:hypothetical protein